MQHLIQIRLLILFLVSISTISWGQDYLKHMVRSTATAKLDTPITIRLKCYVELDTANMPLYVINGKPLASSSGETFIFLNPNNIDNINVYQNYDSVAMSYGDKGKNGVVIVNYKPETKLYSLTEMLNKLCLDNRKQNLKVCINGNYVGNTDGLLFDFSTSFKVKLETGKYFIKGKQISADEIYINIVSGAQ